MPPQDLTAGLEKTLSGTVLILGVGNINKGDDGAGPTLVQQIDGHVSATCIDAGVAPENFLEKIVSENPDTVLIVDATDFGGDPGEARLFDASQVRSGGLSTHALSLDMADQYLKGRIDTHIHLLGIQPGQTESEGLSRPVKDSVQSLAATFLKLLSQQGR